jgi:hypothetical protein
MISAACGGKEIYHPEPPTFYVREEQKYNVAWLRSYQDPAGRTLPNVKRKQGWRSDKALIPRMEPFFAVFPGKQRTDVAGWVRTS